MANCLLRLFAGVAILSWPLQHVGAETGQQICQAAGKNEFALSADKAAAIRMILDEMVAKNIAPGSVMKIEHRGKTVFSYSNGYSDIERRSAMEADALFRIYSMTKPITSVAAMQLVERGKISLDDPVSKYLPAFNGVSVWTGNAEKLETDIPLRSVLIKDLLRHTAGLTYHVGESSPVRDLYAARGIPAGPGVENAPADGSEPVTSLAMLVERIAATPLLNQPGAAFSYGNATDVLGRVVEVVSGQRLSNYFQSEIFDPLSLQDIMFHVPEHRTAMLTSAYTAKSLVPEGSPLLTATEITAMPAITSVRIDDGSDSIYATKPDIEFGGAGLVSTASDYLRFTKAMRQGGKLDGKRILNDATIQLMMQNQLPDQALASSTYLNGLGFGYGFAVRLAQTDIAPVFPQCAVFWGGAASTMFWIDGAGEVSGVLMTQVFGGDVRSYWLEILKILYATEVSPPFEPDAN
jgi:CubicO group peptidase (beta-lactamase class C family)